MKPDTLVSKPAALIEAKSTASPRQEVGHAPAPRVQWANAAPGLTDVGAYHYTERPAQRRVAGISSNSTGAGTAGGHYVRGPLQRRVADPVSPHAPSASRNAFHAGEIGGIVQRQVGPNADDEQVVELSDPETIYIAKRNAIGSYDLFDVETMTYYTSIDEDDDDFELLSEYDPDVRSSGSSLSDQSGVDDDDDGNDGDDENAPPFSITSDQKARRVYTRGPRRGSGGFHDLVRAGKEDYSYGDLSQVFHGARRRAREEEEVDEAIATGTSLPLEDGEIPVDPEHDVDLQLVPFHVLMYQQFHTPPNLKSKKRLRENPWRQEELDKTKAWMELPGAQGLSLMLPPSQERLRDFYPGPIDISFPPDAESLFTYAENKAIYKLNKQMLLKAYLKGTDRRDEDFHSSKRKRLTKALYETVGEQDESVAKGSEERYVKRKFGLRRTDGESSLDEASSEEEVEDFDFRRSDSAKDRSAKRKTYLNTLGLLVKLYNRKILDDLRSILHATNLGDEDEALLAEARLQKHRQLLDKLELKYGEATGRFKELFAEIVGTIEYVKKKVKLLDSLKPEGDMGEQTRRRYLEAMEEYLHAKPSGSGSRPLEGVGKQGLTARLKRSKSERAAALDSLAEQYGGSLQYGGSDGNNCLIFAIANAVGRRISAQNAQRIREALYRANYAGVDRHGYLPATTRVVDVITQFVLASFYDDARDIPAITVHIDTVLDDIAPVVVGNGGVNVYVIHDGGHYWWLKRD